MEIPTPIFVGYRVKKVVRNLPEFTHYGAHEICSFSDCISKPPEGWAERWNFNGYACYNLESTALATISAGQETDYDLFAYWLYPLEFTGDGSIRELDLNPSASESDSDPTIPALHDYELIGYDLVSNSLGLDKCVCVECSPLSCNYCCAEHPVNHYCLIEDLDRAIEVGCHFGKTGPEPGPYLLFKLARKRSHGYPEARNKNTQA